MHQIGESVSSPLTLLEETIDAVQRLLGGERVEANGRYVRLHGVRLEFAPPAPPLVSAGVVGPKSLRLSGRVAGGTILGEGSGPPEIAAAQRHIAAGRAEAGRPGGPPHRLTVFAGFHCGHPSGLAPPNPNAPTGWEAVSEDPASVAAALQTLIDAGADAVVLVPFGIDRLGQLRFAADEIVPLLSQAPPQ